MMEKFKTFWTDLFTELNSEDSIAILVFLGISFLLGLIFGAWSRAGKIRKLKKQVAEKETELTNLRTQYDTLVEQYEKKEEELKVAEARVNEMGEDINRLTSERMHYQTELRSAKEQLERLQEENLNYATQLTGGGGNVVVDENNNTHTGGTTTIISTEDTPNEPTVVDEVQNDRLALIEEKLERLVLENANLREEVANLERGVLTSGGSVLVGGSENGGTTTTSNNSSTVTNTETGEVVLDLSETVVEDAPPTYEDEVLEEDAGEMSPQERAERAKSKIGAALGKKIPKANLSEKDDLKKIEGIGPFIETKLNDVGIYTYEQVSMLDEELVGLITDAIQFFPGRIEKDDWMGQAASLMG
ncbi:MAG: hypothetical protein AAF573_04450 [Bacteroidota bacterium]